MNNAKQGIYIVLFSILAIMMTLYTAFSAPNTASADSIIATVPVGSNPEGITFDASNGDIYVANPGSNTVSVIDGKTNQIVTTIAVGSNSLPIGITFDASNGNLYLANENSGLC